jgi:hypothetical protein
MRRLLGLLMPAVLLAGCAGVPSSSAPQAIGTVERPAPSNLPKPTPGIPRTGIWLRGSSSPSRRPTPGMMPVARC